MDDPVLLQTLKGHNKAVLGSCFEPNSKKFVTCSKDKTLMIWNFLEKNTRCHKFVEHKDVVTSVDFSSDGKLIASSSLDGTVRFWTPKINGTSSAFRPHTSAVKTVSFSPNSKLLVTGSNDKSIKIWDVGTRKFLMSFTGHNNWVNCSKFSPDGKMIVSCADDRTVRIWDITCNQYIHGFACNGGSGNYLDIYSTGNAVAVAMNNGKIKIYDLRAKKLQQSYILHDNTTCVCWLPKSNYLLSSGIDGTIKTIDVMEGRPLYTLESHEGPVYTIRSSPDGEYFISAGEEDLIKVWKTNFIYQGTSTSSLTSD